MRITSGTTALGPTDNPLAGVDVVAMDDFFYSEPTAVPEPATLSLLGMGALTLAAKLRRRSRHANRAATR